MKNRVTFYEGIAIDESLKKLLAIEQIQEFVAWCKENDEEATMYSVSIWNGRLYNRIRRND